ncbi:MAG: hypothetical protein A2902_01910 [Elusimicrobia bacterium RIFCSPLOWO2_01_FULL_64_13]|nr:MAG: hypothetical protein A2902_01910 [Elusimicrobia bacterium RIFCSPLOWO2_01_FULL_64_13]
MALSIKKIVSGGQTGADRAALDYAMAAGIPHGGWVPRGRLTESGPLPARYGMKETRDSGYEERTEKNVADSDGTIVFYCGKLKGGSLLTWALARRRGKPVLGIDLDKWEPDPARTREWIRESRVSILNVAGSRASQAPGIYADVKKYLRELFEPPS